MRPLHFCVAALALSSNTSALLSPDGNPILLSHPYVEASSTLPPTPGLPNTTDSGYVAVNDVKIWYGMFGRPLNESLAHGIWPVVFIHGGFGNSDYFGYQIRDLQHGPWTLITLDSRSQGRSTGLDQPISYDIMTRDVIGVLDHFNVPKATVVGWSDGGIIGLDIAMNFSSRLDRLFAFASQYSFLNTNATVGNSTVFIDYLARAQREYMQLSPIPNNFSTLYNKLNAMFAILPDWDAESFTHIPTLFENGTAPLVWIVDAAEEEVVDRGVPRTLNEWISASGMVILPSVSHFAFLQDPVTFNAMLRRFLTYH